MALSLSLDDFQAIYDEHRDVEQKMSDPAVLSDPAKARPLGRRYAELGRMTAAIDEWKAAGEDLEVARELAEDDASMAEEIPALTERLTAAEAALTKVLAPRDPDDARDVIMEIKAGAGGEESALFAADLMRMYTRYAEVRGWSVQVLGATESDLGGIKDAQIAIKAKGNPAPEDGVWAALKYEGGVHRVQRVPVTESQGRIHTSAAGVLVMPEAEETGEIEIDMNDLRIDVFRSSGPGGQSVNTTDSAVRITHVPTGIVVSMQNEKSQIQNREAAMRVLRSRLLAEEQAKREAEAAEARHSQVRTVDRSERIRTYNFPENRIADHRTGYKAYNLDAVLGGDLQPVIDSAIEMDEAERLKKFGEDA
ncbi:peptide chain release factor 1 [Nanchangia anserum]|uniref:Peptide chain release factor 1 n=1 Tax=Nanchangia anserum TaxID=2692125 RepID=A0A8I0GEB6_9ACTO|nr:peptide chain release factor 1 [Nanchangia anserum]MBD3689943.1 peptide chain release factor 1 [Nanchangia anserum]QOX82245.1 peptide chain release factor 1 [Nanchangia anserum]